MCCLSRHRHILFAGGCLGSPLCRNKRGAGALTFIPYSLHRYSVRDMMCMHCFTEQPAAAQCSNVACGKSMAHYFCKVCNLWDDDQTKKIYHCHDCGLCRIGEGLGMYSNPDTALGMRFKTYVKLSMYKLCTTIERSRVPFIRLCRQGLFPLQDVQRVHVIRAQGQAQVY